MNLHHRIFESEELDIVGFSDIPPDRCCYCKKELFAIKDIDLKELGTRSPLYEAVLTKDEIKKILDETWPFLQL